MRYNKESKESKIWDWKEPTFSKSFIIVCSLVALAYVNIWWAFTAIACILGSLLLWGIWYTMVEY